MKEKSTLKDVANNYLTHTIIYNSNYKEQLISFIKELGLDYNTPDLELGEIDWLLQSLNFNCMSPRIHLYERCHHILLL